MFRADLGDQPSKQRRFAGSLRQLADAPEVVDSDGVALVVLCVDRGERSSLVDRDRGERSSLVDRDRVEWMIVLAGRGEREPEPLVASMFTRYCPGVVDLTVEEEDLDQHI